MFRACRADHLVFDWNLKSGDSVGMRRNLFPVNPAWVVDGVTGVGHPQQAARSLRRCVVARSLAACRGWRSSLNLMVSKPRSRAFARSKHHRGTTMDHYAGIDVSLE